MDLQLNEVEAIKRLKESDLFSKRFGSFSKSDYEILMFTIFLDSLKKPANDYDISLELGITESKVRSLRIKSQLAYPKKLNWQDELLAAMQNYYFDPSANTLTIMIEDPSVQNLISHKIEQAHGIVKLAFNKKHLELPIGSYVMLALEAEKEQGSDKAEKDILKEINSQLQKENTLVQKVTKENLPSTFLSKFKDPSAILGIISIVVDHFSPENRIISMILSILQKITG